MKYKVKRMQYKINDRISGFRYVDGYAIDSGLPVRICVRRHNNRKWKCDHYDSGYWFGAYQPTMKKAAEYAVERMWRAIEDGTLARAIKDAGL